VVVTVDYLWNTVGCLW